MSFLIKTWAGSFTDVRKARLRRAFALLDTHYFHW